MRRATLTTTELRYPAGHSHVRRRLIAAVFGILALLTQAGFTLGASAAMTAAPPGSLAADLAKLCLGAIDDASGGREDSSQEYAPDCEHCTLCGVSAATALPSDSPNTAWKVTASGHLAAGPYQAYRQSFIRLSNPRAPPL
ncbi:DUF2946 family protein [Nisaea nitritireducens]|uniref:DUF2946 family protein n=1 Tax=Nisaea nitritireducens TaxID=568392 RepID=UPI001867B5B1|nr:DUF2946 family protein [Nisaea nitritireducens]